MSSAFYIVLERPIKGFDHFVNGKALARAGEILDTLAKKSGTNPLMTFWSADPDELSEIAAGLGATAKQNAKPLPPAVVLCHRGFNNHPRTQSSC